MVFAAYADLMKTLRVKLTAAKKEDLLAGLADLELIHGDFAVLLRRYSALRIKPDSQQLLKDLKREAAL